MVTQLTGCARRADLFRKPGPQRIPYLCLEVSIVTVDSASLFDVIMPLVMIGGKDGQL